MNDLGEDCFSSGQSATSVAVVVNQTPKDTSVRPHGEKLKMMNPTPNGYSDVPNHKHKTDNQDSVKKHSDSSKSNDHQKHSSPGKHNSDHVKRKEGSDATNHKSSSSHSSSKDIISSKDSSVKTDSSKLKEHSSSKEKKHHSSHKDSKDGKHSESSKHSSTNNEGEKSDKANKEHKHSSSKPKLDNFKENEKVKDGKIKESKDKIKEKHKDKHKESKDKISEHSKEKSDKNSDHSKEKLDKISQHSKEKSEKISEHSKDKVEKQKDKSSDKHKEKHLDKSKDKTNEKPKEKLGEKLKEKLVESSKDRSGEKMKEKSSEKMKEKSSEKIKEKSGEKLKEKSIEKPKEKINEKSKNKMKYLESDDEESSAPLKPKDSSPPLKKVKTEIESEDEMPLAARKTVKVKTVKKEIKEEPDSPVKRKLKEESDDEPLSLRAEKAKKIKSEKPVKKRKQESDYEDDEDDYDDYKKPPKKVKKEKPTKKTKEEPSSPKKKVKKEDDQDVWKWWEEEKLDEGLKWRTLEHNGPVFAPPYERVPKNVKFYYDGKHMELSEVAEEVAGFYGRMLDHEYTTKDSFNKNFFKDWRKVMTQKEREIIVDLKKCKFNDFDAYYKMKSEERKAMTKEQKAEIKKQNEELTEKYGFCVIDSHRQKIGNFKIEPPGLFRGRGEHPKMGMLKRRVEAEDISINLSKGAKIPDPPPGHKWKDVRHDNTVTWLCSWSENILGSTKYIMLNPSSKLKGEKDWQKYETARKLKNHADRIRKTYTEDFKSKEMKVRQRAVALYFIDKLALRAGNEKDEDTADTVGCCSLRVEHITLDEEKDGQEYVVSFDFLGKDSIRYFNSVPVEKRAYKNLKLFMENKQPGDDLFDRLNTAILNKYLNELMEGLTAKVFRTYNASKTLQEQLDLLTKEDMSLPEKILAYNRANRAVAVLCNHQRAVPKGFSKSMENLKTKMDEKLKQIKDCKRDVKELKNAAKHSAKEKIMYDKKKKRLQTLEEQFRKLEVQATDREENKQIALGTSKLNYLDPRISVAWCKKWDVPIEKVYNRTQRDKFRWAIEMAGPEFKF